MKKRIIAFFTLIVLTVSVSGCYQTVQIDTPSNTKDWNITDGSLNSYTGTDGIVEIPDDVTTINSGAFTADNNIKAVVIPPQVSAIAEDSFKDKDNLTLYAQSNFQMLENVAKKNNFQLKAIAKDDSSNLINISVKNGTVLYNDEAGLAVVTLPDMQQTCDITVSELKGNDLVLYSDVSLSLRAQTPVSINQYETNLYAMTSGQKLIQITILSKRDTVQYSDKKEISDSAKPAVNMINNRGYGLFKGDQNLKFNPLNNITRYELAEIISNTLGLESTGFSTYTEIEFDDEIDPEYQQYVKAVTATGVMGAVSGDGKTVFAGESLVTREQFAGIMVRSILYYNNVDLTAEKVYLALKDEIEQKYHALDLQDMEDVSYAELKNVKLAAAYYNVLSPVTINSKAYISPKENITREQAAECIASILGQRMEGSKILYTPEYSIDQPSNINKFDLNNNVAIIEFNEIFEANADSNEANTAISYAEFVQAVDLMLDSGMTPTTLSDFYSGKCEKDKNYFIVMLTGVNDETYKLAQKALSERQINADIFIYTDMIGSGQNAVSLDTLWQLTDSGSSIYSHYSKPIDLTSELDDNIKSELIAGFYKLEALFGTTDKFFAYPMSSYNQHTYNIVKAGTDLQLVEHTKFEGENLLYYYNINQDTDLSELLTGIYLN